MNCVPVQLVAEFYTTVDNSATSIEDIWMEVAAEVAAVDSITYMYYLQYLTFRNTGLIIDKHRAFENLHRHMPYVLSHNKTSLNLLGHCWELEG